MWGVGPREEFGFLNDFRQFHDGALGDLQHHAGRLQPGADNRFQKNSPR